MNDHFFEETEYAGFWLRLAAFLIDTFIIDVTLYALVLILGLTGYSVWGAEAFDPVHGNEAVLLAGIMGTILIISLIGVVGTWLYFAIQESSEAQATLGKRAVGIIVTDMEGERISFGHATGRFFGKIISSMIFMVGYLMAGFTEQKQALHDIMAGTLVLKG